MLFCSEYSLYNFQNCLMEKVTETSFSCFFHFFPFSLYPLLYSTFHQIYSLQMLFLSSFIFELRSWNYEYRWMRVLLETQYEVYWALYFSPFSMVPFEKGIYFILSISCSVTGFLDRAAVTARWKYHRLLYSHIYVSTSNLGWKGFFERSHIALQKKESSIVGSLVKTISFIKCYFNLKDFLYKKNAL